MNNPTDFNRATGRTTRRVLKYLLAASQHPGILLCLEDHHGTKMADEHLVYQVRCLAAAMPTPDTWVIDKKAKDGTFWLTFIPRA